MSARGRSTDRCTARSCGSTCLRSTPNACSERRSCSVTPSCYLGEAPPVTARPVLSGWGPDSTWDDRPPTGRPGGRGCRGRLPQTATSGSTSPALVRAWSAALRRTWARAARRRVLRRAAGVRDAGWARRRARPALRSGARVSIEVELVTDSPRLRHPPLRCCSGRTCSSTSSVRRSSAVSCPSRRRSITESSVEAPQLASARPTRRARSCLRLSPADPAIAGVGRPPTTDGSTSTRRSSRATASSSRSFSRARSPAAPGRREKQQVDVQFDSAAAIGAQAPGRPHGLLRARFVPCAAGLLRLDDQAGRGRQVHGHRRGARLEGPGA